MQLTDIKTAYFLGIGGIGMSALARYMHSKGILVSGYDKTKTPLTELLEQEGIPIHYEPNPSSISSAIDVVVYTPAVPSDFAEWEAIEKLKIQTVKRSAMLSIVVNSLPLIAVAGTHGKTTVSAMIAHCFEYIHQPFLGFVGGVLGKYNTNVFVHRNAKWAVAEADEYDRSFLALRPFISVINAIDADHLDIYGSATALQDSFSEFAAQTSPQGQLLVCSDIDRSKLTLPQNHILFGIDTSEGYSANNVRIENGKFVFDISLNDSKLFNSLPIPIAGRHNVRNAVAAFAALHLAGFDPKQIAEALQTYPGVKRRLELIAKSKNIVYFDDYAHHPTEIEALLETIRSLYPEKTITGIFQPHLFSRTRDFGVDFARVLSKFDIPIVSDIYPAREKAIAGIDAQWLLNQIDNEQKQYIAFENIGKIDVANMNGVLLTIGAGDIDNHIETLKNRILSL
jgi:UDP-N-acetylmuramate--alanine ligase